MALCSYICGEYTQCENDETLSTEEFTECLPRTRYANESRKHWEMTLHCEKVAYPRSGPNLPLLSRIARYYWNLYTATAKHQPLYQKELNQALITTLNKILNNQILSKSVMISQQLVRLDTFDDPNRRRIIDRFEEFICRQTTLETVCLEGLSLTRSEGVRLVLALYGSRKTVKYLYCWRAFKRKEGPLLVNTGHLAGSRLYSDRNIRKCDWFRGIGCLESLTTLSVNYAYVATPTGDLLIHLSKILGSKWKWLQLLCLNDEIPIMADPDDGIGGYGIPDAAWQKIRSFAPCLKVQLAIIGIPEYDKHKRFLTINTPVHTFALFTELDLQFRQPCFLACTIKTLCAWYSSILEYLNLNLWHQREILDPQLKKILIDLPALRVFEFTGEIRSLKTICAMCCQIRSKKSHVRTINLTLQSTLHMKMDKEQWEKSIQYLIVCFKKDFDNLGVKFNVSVLRNS